MWAYAASYVKPYPSIKFDETRSRDVKVNFGGGRGGCGGGPHLAHVTFVMVVNSNGW